MTMTEPRIPTLEEFRAEAREWLATQWPQRPDDVAAIWGEGSDSVSVFHDVPFEEELALDKAIRDWHQKKIDAGWALFTWPERFGGRNLPSAYERAFVEEEARFIVPREHETFNVTVNLVGPTIAVYGTEEQQDRFIPPFIRTDMLCCQLFSEPNAGSDLASLSCSAKQVGDSWIIDGQKVWTSGARLSEYGLLIARSDTTGVKHAGMTAFLLPLNLPGVEIRPIRQMTGGASFNEVFMTNVELSDDYRLGAVGEGWKVALTTLGFERNSSADGAGGAGGTPQQLIALAQHLGKNADPIARQMLAEVYSMGRIAELSGLRMRGTLSAGQDPGPLGSLGKLFWTQRLNRTSDVASYLLGADLMADSGEWGKYAWAEHVLGAPGYRIAGGSDEIQRNIIGERALGLPREPR